MSLTSPPGLCITVEATRFRGATRHDGHYVHSRGDATDREEEFLQVLRSVARPPHFPGHLAGEPALCARLPFTWRATGYDSTPCQSERTVLGQSSMSLAASALSRATTTHASAPGVEAPGSPEHQTL